MAATPPRCDPGCVVRRWLLLGALVAAACGDDEVAAGGDGTDTAATGTAATGASDGGVDETGTSPPACESDVECDDADPCTVDSCDAGMCTSAPIDVVTNECRPTIEVDDPVRGATVLGAVCDREVLVHGHVSSGMAPIASLTLNGEAVAVGADGSFAHPVQTVTGGNLLVFETQDEAGYTRRRVQSFLWSTAFDQPTVPSDGMAPQGLALYLAQESIDDGDRSPPIDDVASLLQIVFDGFDVSALFDPNTPIANYAGYDIYITDLALGASSIAVEANDGGLTITATIDDILGDLFYDCTQTGCFFAGGDSTGGFSVVALDVVADLQLDVGEDHQLQANLQSVDVIIDPDDVEVWSDNPWTDFLISVVEVFVHDSLVAEFESALETTIEEDFGPVLTEGLSQIALALSFDFPNLGNAREPIVVDLAADFAATEFHDGASPPSPSPPQGGAVILRGGGFPSRVVSTYENAGVLRRAGCGTGTTEIALERAAPFEISLHDDLINQLLHAGWRGGLLEFPLGAEQLGMAGGGLIEDLSLVVSGMLAPTAADCVPGQDLKITLGDIRIDAELTLLGDPVTFVSYTTLVAGLDIATTEDGIAIGLGAVERVETELTANDEAIDLEQLLIDSLQDQLVDGLLGELGGLGSFSIPDIDVGGLLGLPPGEAVLHVTVQDVTRRPGTSVVGGHL